MNALIAAAIAVILTLPRPWFPEEHRPETDAEREARISRLVTRVVARAEEESKRIGYTPIEVTSLSLAIAYNESALAWEVHAGQEWPKRPPPFGDNGRAACVFQLQPSAAQVPFDEWRPFEPDEWRSLAGLSERSTRLCVKAGVRAVAYHAWRCRGRLARARALGDHVYIGTVVASQYHQPRLPCGYFSRGSVRRGHLYKTLLYRLHKRLSQSQGAS